MKNFIKQTKISFILMAIMYIVFGILFLTRPNFTNKIIVTILGLMLSIYGISQILKHVNSDDVEKVQSFHLSIGIITLLIGIYFFIKPDIIISILGAILGLFLFLHGALNLQHAFNLKNMYYEKWWVLTIFGIISIILGFYGVMNPTSISPVFSIVIGLGMIISGLSDIFIIYKISSHFK
ncbi:hypothetical protein FYJ27_06240 [Anaerosalibacter bizertensis]|uniref:DUF308 domain-containing protein n=1 Tax=Anaerosalibacter bizertensis TaxID=932217 RepID=A0A844FHB1_9FIRM|nr:DUF308 domain-containing protein [Anaerosalibacter bizertensis]MBV1819818.1 DUF308 domain-containing protein [Bacteroidales bacterium MSK.15.36]MCG4564698.1 DUF308 domain-containing protein [Anaerosalibacter bizertensis]MCG4583179.1 DUF308 domain-containing protein [Anaerosalibacter bizertensis]MSS43332.1 hypothetical protein [Anaerosalibacter bizertensis]